jgi:hypothetical protein
MQVSFTGFKNVGYVPVVYYPAVAKDEEGNEVHSKDVFLDIKSLNLQLTDDVFGKDLSEYKDKLSHAKFEPASHPISSDFVNISTIEPHANGEIYKDQFLISLNGREVEVKDENLPMLSFLAKLVRRVSEQPAEKFVVNNDYVNGDEVASSICLGHDLSEDFETPDDYKKGILYIHNPVQVHDGAQDIKEQIDDKMLDYFS